MQDYWNQKFLSKETIWGEEASDSAIYTRNFFLMQNAHKVLVPGLGYGRNAKVFSDAGMHVSGIEISKEAIEMAKKVLPKGSKFFNASVTEMPLSNDSYDGIYCYALAHLLNKEDRKAFILNCYMHLKPGASMLFMVISKKDRMYGQGKKIAKDTFQIEDGLQVFFYDIKSIKADFGDFGLVAYQEFEEPIKHMKNEEPIKCYIVKCQRK